jgi:serine incorporator 1/3
MLAWLMKTPFAIKQVEKWSYDYIKMDCDEDKCYGVLAVSSIYADGFNFMLNATRQVHRICFALCLFHGILGISLIGVKDTRDKRAAIQNG